MPDGVGGLGARIFTHVDGNWAPSVGNPPAGLKLPACGIRGGTECPCGDSWWALPRRSRCGDREPPVAEGCPGVKGGGGQKGDPLLPAHGRYVSSKRTGSHQRQATWILVLPIAALYLQSSSTEPYSTRHVVMLKDALLSYRFAETWVSVGCRYPGAGWEGRG